MMRQSIDALVEEAEQTHLSGPTERSKSAEEIGRLERQVDMLHRNTRLLATHNRRHAGPVKRHPLRTAPSS